MRYADGRVAVAKCGKWDCACCAKVRSHKLVKRMGERRFRWLVTFTAPSTLQRCTREEVMKFNEGWRRVYQWLKREHPPHRHASSKSKRTWRHGSFSPSLTEYIFSNERGETTGHLHKHVVIQSSWFCFACLRARLSRYGLGDVCDFKRIKQKRGWGSMRAVNYVVKYVTKGSGKYKLPRYSRKVQCSHLAPEEKKHEWSFLSGTRDHEFLNVLVPDIVVPDVSRETSVLPSNST